jgi:hypothetical protein
VSVGPEISALGNKCFEAQRLGLFAAFDVTSNFHLVVSGGYHWQDESFRDGDGGYATVHLRLAY